MNKVATFLIVSMLYFSGYQLLEERFVIQSSESEAWQVMLTYIESFNRNNTRGLADFFSTYYEHADLNRRLETERSLKKSWGSLKIERIVWDSGTEIIMVVETKKMNGSALLFDIRLKETEPGKIDYFIRTGIPVPDDDIGSLTDRDVMYFVDRSVPVNDSIIVASVLGIAEAYDSCYYSRLIGRRISDVIIENLNRGKYAQITRAGRLADSLNRDIQEIQFDRHSWIAADRRLLTVDSVSDRFRNYGIEEAEILDGNTGYLKINEFSPLKEAQVLATRILISLSGCSSLIIDLRDNHGGYPQMVEYISGYFFHDPVKINTLFDRNGKLVEELWTQDTIPGERFPRDLPVVILTSQRTASAAESFVELYKRTGRATIIGESTNGAHHPAREIEIGSIFVVSVPFLTGDAIDLTEGVGIDPNISVSSELALERAIEYLK